VTETFSTTLADLIFENVVAICDKKNFWNTVLFVLHTSQRTRHLCKYDEMHRSVISKKSAIVGFGSK